MPVLHDGGPPSFQIQGISLSTYSAGGYADSSVVDMINRAAQSGANHVVFSNIVMADLKTGAIGDVIENGQNQTASLADVGRAVAAAKAAGLDVVLKPQIAVHDAAFDQYNSASWINMVNPDLVIENPAAFFASYKAHILQYAAVAEQNHIAMLSIGNEMVAATKPQYTAYWNDIIDSVRAVYHGDLVYSALAPVSATATANEIKQIGFWSKLDYAGFDVFPTLSNVANPTVEQLAAAWHDFKVFGQSQNYADFLGSMAAVTGKPVIFTETGLPSFDRASDRIATSDGNIGDGSHATDQAEQADWWQAFFQTWAVNTPSWLKGVLLINNDPAKLGAYHDQNYNIDGKLAEPVVAAWFGGATTIAPDASTLQGSAGSDHLYLYGAGTSASQAASFTTKVSINLTGAIVNGAAPVVRIQVNGTDYGAVALKPIDSGYVNAQGVHFSVDQTYAFELPGLVAINQLKVAFEGRATTFFEGVEVNGVALKAASYFPAGGGTYAAHLPAPGVAGDASPWDGGYMLFDASPWNASLAARTIGAPSNPIVVDGAGGTNIVHVLGLSGQYSLTRIDATSVQLTEAGGLGQNAVLKNISAVEFADGSRVSLGGVQSAATTGVRTGGLGDDQLIGGAGADTISDPAGSNVLRGGEGNDLLTGGTGFDDINGNQGADTVIGGGGDDWVVGGKDNDRLLGEAGDDIGLGNMGADTIEGGDGSDQLRGGQGDDVVIGGAGNDLVSGDRGSDTVTGGAGADRFHTFRDAGLDRVTDFRAAEGDVVLLDPGTSYVVRQQGADTVIDMGSGSQMILANVEVATLHPGWIVEGWS